MSLDHLWAGWRSEYISGLVQGEKPTGCLFCALSLDSNNDNELHVIYRDELTIVALNAFPYSSGHVMIAPIRHVGQLEEIEPHESAAMWNALNLSVRAIKTAYKPDGLNMGANIGRVAGAGVPDHVHLHALPRWNGDTNFMTSVADTRVLPEALSVCADRLRASWPS